MRLAKRCRRVEKLWRPIALAAAGVKPASPRETPVHSRLFLLSRIGLRSVQWLRFDSWSFGGLRARRSRWTGEVGQKALLKETCHAAQTLGRVRAGNPPDATSVHAS